MYKEIQENTDSIHRLGDAVIEEIRAKVNERRAMEQKFYTDGTPLFEKIKKEYRERLMLAIQTHRATFDEELQKKFGCEEDCRKREAILDADNEGRCPRCGAQEQFQKKPGDHAAWLGICETDDCECGAAYEHQHPSCKKPLNEKSIASLLQTARDVEWAYANVNLQMTSEQIAMNRNYFGRIITALAMKKHNHISDRYLRCIESLRFSERYDEMMELMAKVDGERVARAYMKYGDPPGDLAELDSMIAEMELELTAKTLLSS